MKKAFTMIELIFVIVILGILAAVALPKFLGVAEQAHEGNLKSFVGTLNRSVGPTLWSTSISNGHNGDISYTGLTENNITTYVDLPKEIGTVKLSECNDSTKDKVVIQIKEAVAGTDYVITCRDGNANQSPKFKLYKCNGTNASTDCGIADGTDISTKTNVTEVN
ncbi:hypothetical protein JCM11957_07710 [Caminibacter profundus]